MRQGQRGRETETRPRGLGLPVGPPAAARPAGLELGVGVTVTGRQPDLDSLRHLQLVLLVQEPERHVPIHRRVSIKVPMAKVPENESVMQDRHASVMRMHVPITCLSQVPIICLWKGSR